MLSMINTYFSTSKLSSENCPFQTTLSMLYINIIDVPVYILQVYCTQLRNCEKCYHSIICMHMSVKSLNLQVHYFMSPVVNFTDTNIFLFFQNHDKYSGILR